MYACMYEASFERFCQTSPAGHFAAALQGGVKYLDNLCS